MSNQIIVCPICNKEFSKRKKTSKYCSQACHWKGLIKRDYSKQICLMCGKEFVPHRETKGMYCSRQCQWESMRTPEEVLQQRQYLKQLTKQFKQVTRILYKVKEEINNRLKHNKVCIECGSKFTANILTRKYCSKRCVNKVKNRQKWKRLYQNGKPDLSITLAKLYVRDNGVCALCGRELNFDCDSNSNYYPSIDHIIPISKGGKHVWDNVQLVCRNCNNKKRNNILYFRKI